MDPDAPVIIDGRDDRARALDAEVESWAGAHGWYEDGWRKYPSWRARREGLQIPRRWGILQCPTVVRESNLDYHPLVCGYFIVAEKRQQTAKCPKCGARSWLRPLKPLAWSDRPERLRQLIPVLRHRWGNAWPLPHPGDLDSYSLPQGPEGGRGGMTAAKDPGDPGPRHGLVATLQV